MFSLDRRDRTTLLIAVVPTLLIIALGWFMFISPQHSKTADLRSQANDSVDQAAVANHHIANLRAQSKNLPAYAAQLASDRLALPLTSDVPNFLRSLQTISASSGVAITDITVGQPAPLTAAATTTNTTSTTASTGTSGSTSTTPHIGVAGAVYQMNLSVTVTGAQPSLIAFLQQLQQGQPRAVLINTTSFTQATGGTSLTVEMLAFLAPSSS